MHSTTGPDATKTQDGVCDPCSDVPRDRNDVR